MQHWVSFAEQIPVLTLWVSSFRLLKSVMFAAFLNFEL